MTKGNFRCYCSNENCESGIYNTNDNTVKTCAICGSPIIYEKIPQNQTLIDYWKKFAKELRIFKHILKHKNSDLSLAPVQMDFPYHNLGYKMSGGKIAFKTWKQIDDLIMNAEIIIDMLSRNKLGNSKQLYMLNNFI